MIFYLTRQVARTTVSNMLAEWRRDLQGLLVPLTYEELAQRSALAPGAYLFTDSERCSAEVVAALGRLAARLEAAGPRVRVLNDPRRLRLRAELIPHLHALGRIDYTIHRLGAALRSPQRVRFPVILRQDRGHRGALTEPLPDRRALWRAAAAAVARGFSPQHLLVAEFLATADADGRVPLLQAYLLGGEAFAASLGYSQHWEAHFGFPGDREGEEAVRRFVAENPHRDWLRGIAAEAGIDYGRVDYGIWNGRPQLWEVNTNAELTYPKAKCPPFWLEVQELHLEAIARQCRAWDLPSEGPAIDAAEELASLAQLLKPPLIPGTRVPTPDWRERLRRSERLASWLGQRPVRRQRRPEWSRAGER